MGSIGEAGINAERVQSGDDRGRAPGIGWEVEAFGHGGVDERALLQQRQQAGVLLSGTAVAADTVGAGDLASVGVGGVYP